MLKHLMIGFCSDGHGAMTDNESSSELVLVDVSVPRSQRISLAPLRLRQRFFLFSS